jgi:hypothetical protein
MSTECFTDYTVVSSALVLAFEWKSPKINRMFGREVNEDRGNKLQATYALGTARHMVAFPRH